MTEREESLLDMIKRAREHAERSYTFAPNTYSNEALVAVRRIESTVRSLSKTLGQEAKK
jgi:hypothetical protein